MLANPPSIPKKNIPVDGAQSSYFYVSLFLKYHLSHIAITGYSDMGVKQIGRDQCGNIRLTNVNLEGLNERIFYSQFFLECHSEPKVKNLVFIMFVIPAAAPESRFFCHSRLLLVIPAKAGI